VRPALVVGPFDPTDRFTYWPARFRRGGTVLAPGRPERVVQFIDVRDLAEFMVRLVEARATGVLQATGPDAPLPFGDVLAACARVAAGRGAPPATVRWVDEDWLVAREVAPWMGLPLWIPDSMGDMAGLMRGDIARARAAGLVFRPLEDTIAATLEWDATRPADVPRGAGISPEVEARLLADAPA
ncbi:MAG: epimerase, partial [Candidatus Eisenbacteria bacterium]